jgi:ABC-type antimicrobial peptide transport system permease subunit
VRWHALTVAAVGLAAGIPLGLAFGRVAYRAFATGLGVLPDPVVPFPWVLVVVAATVGIGLLASVGPGHRAARVAAGEALRDE